MSLSAEQRSMRARIGAYSLHARYDPRETTQAARAAFHKRFEDAVDPERLLSPGERERRAAAALQAHMTSLALKSSLARSSRPVR